MSPGPAPTSLLIGTAPDGWLTAMPQAYISQSLVASRSFHLLEQSMHWVNRVWPRLEAWARKLGVVWDEWGFGLQGTLSLQEASVPCDHTLFSLLGGISLPFCPQT